MATRMMADSGGLMMTYKETVAAWEKWKKGQRDTEMAAKAKPHPLEPQPAKKCTCGAHSCGHSGHSSWCDLA